MDIEINYLFHKKHLIKEIASLFYKEWSYLHPQKTLKGFQNSIAERVNIDKIPLAVVATKKEEFIGTACIKEFDMDTRKDLSPWLAGVYVQEKYRGMRIGGMLKSRIYKEAERIGIKKLYLFTPTAEAYYRKHGWVPIAQEIYNGTNVVVMEIYLHSST
ncbi:MAG: GNAT family N-acetyltransferase, partial [Lentisphaerota bacterium]